MKKIALIVFFSIISIFVMNGIHTLAEENNQALEVGSIIKFGGYDWEILDIQDNKALVITSSVVSCFPFTSDYYDEHCWAVSALRSYLNGEFYLSTFSDEEKEAIIETEINNDVNLVTGIQSGPITTDKLFVLSLDEVLHYFGGSSLESVQMSEYYDFVIDDSNNAYRKATHIGGTYVEWIGDYKHTISFKKNEDCWWWLRTMGYDENRVVCVDYDGSVIIDGYRGSQGQGGVRPAMWIDMDKSHLKSDSKAETSSDALKKGSKGDRVKALQVKLIQLGYLKGSADGDFGKKTEAAVKEFQLDYNLEANGIATAETMELLFSIDLTSNDSTTIPEPTSPSDSGKAENSHSTNTKKAGKNGNSGVYAYVSRGGTYENYYVIDFDEGYVYYFSNGNGSGTCDRVKIVSGDLNSVLIITYHDGGDEWSYGLHFKWKNQPDHLILQDNDGFEYDFYSTSLDNALRIMKSKTIYDY